MAALLVPMTPVVKMSSFACGVLENEVVVPPLVVVVVAMSFSRECFLESPDPADRTKSHACTAQGVKERCEVIPDIVGRPGLREEGRRWCAGEEVRRI
ncbi:hypothetical protein M5C90_12295 [Pseudomonas chlororaphis subsp. piscium]|nr:hypothetical protein M5C90_12295 [Pseudomonas chlororaphis subsp. piscium]